MTYKQIWLRSKRTAGAALLALVLGAGSLAAWSLAAPVTVRAQDSNPQCAVRGLGLISCPIGVGNATNNCYVRDPFGAKPGAWTQYGCQSAEFTSAATKAATADCGLNPNQPTCDVSQKCENGQNCDLVKKYINPAVTVASALVGIGVTIAIILGGIQYSQSADDARAVAAAKRRIAIALFVLVGYALFFAFLNWIVPGGVV